MQYSGPEYKVLFHQTCVIGERRRLVKIFTQPIATQSARPFSIEPFLGDRGEENV